MSAFDLFMTIQNKKANEAVGAGSVGNGPQNMGMQDSDPATATNSALSAQRAAASAAPVGVGLEPDGGMGTNKSIPTAMPGQNLFQAVEQAAATGKVATIVEYAKGFAEQCMNVNMQNYANTKSASSAEQNAWFDKLASSTIEDGYEMGRRFALQRLAGKA